MDDLQLPTTLGTVGRQTPVQTARFIKRRLRDHWPHQRFWFHADKDRLAISVTWTAGPTAEQVHDVTRHHSPAATPPFTPPSGLAPAASSA